MNIDRHKEKLKESLELIDESIQIGIEKRQRTIGFNTSIAAADMLEIYLHQKNLIDPGFVIKHEWFKSKNKLADKFPFDFEEKEQLFQCMQYIEQQRDSLCYGIPKHKEEIMKVLIKFNELKEIFKKAGVEYE
jgi:hypothetical protein